MLSFRRNFEVANHVLVSKFTIQGLSFSLLEDVESQI